MAIHYNPLISWKSKLGSSKIKPDSKTGSFHFCFVCSVLSIVEQFSYKYVCPCVCVCVRVIPQPILYQNVAYGEARGSEIERHTLVRLTLDVPL